MTTTEYALPAVNELADEIVGLAGRLAAANCRWLLLIADFDAAEGGSCLGFNSTSAWLAYACGLTRRTATDHVRVAQTLAAFPDLAAAMSAGRLSYSHARAISRVARAGETRLVSDLIEIAEHGTATHLEVVIRGLQTVDDNERRGQGWQPDEYVRHSWTDDAQWRLAGRLDPERGAMVQSAITAIAKAERLSEVDALVRLAEIGLAAVAQTGGVVDAPRLRGDERTAVVIHLDAAAITARPAESVAEIGSAEPIPSTARPRPSARIVNGPGLPDRVVKRLLCAGRIRTVVRDGNNVLDLGRSHRLVSDRLHRALMIRDQGHCRHPGCDNTRGLEAHHVIHWLDGGRTDLENLILLCPRHHHSHHDYEFTIAGRANAGLQFIRRDGTIITDHVDPAQHITTDVWLEDEHTAVAARAATTRWDGQRMDRDYAISVIAQRREFAERDRLSA